MPQGYKIFYTSSSRAEYYGKADVHYAAVSGYRIGRTMVNRLRALLQENLTAFSDKYSLYDVEPWSKTIRAAIAALFSIITP